jgi:hypothetical protein
VRQRVTDWEDKTDRTRNGFGCLMRLTGTRFSAALLQGLVTRLGKG